MAKWWKWLTNPLGGIIQDVTKNSKPGGFLDSFSHIMNPVQSIGQGISDIFTKERSSKLVRSDIEELAKKNGFSLEEFLEINPDLKKVYDEADLNAFQKIKKRYNENISDKVDAFVDNITGQRDVEENERNRQFQHDEAEINRSWEEEQAKAAREWDSIGAQMERASAAGVNPISIAMQNGGINSSATTSIPSAPSTPSGSSGLMHNGLLDIASTVFNGIGTFAEQRLKQSQSDDIVIMRDYNIAEKMANIDHLRQLCQGVELSNVAQSIQNRWLDVMNQVTYDNMLLDKGVKRATILEKRSVAKLNLQQVDSIVQSMELDLKKFNATLPLELQLMESQIDINKMSVQDIYYEICMKHLQAIEQENRNRQSAAEAGSAEVAEFIARQTYEDAIAAFHNDMLKSAADAGVALYDYMYYGNNYKGFFDWMGKTERGMFSNRLRRNKVINDVGTRVIIPQNSTFGN